MDRILTEAEHVLSPYVTAEGRVAFDSPAHIVTRTTPQRVANRLWNDAEGCMVQVMAVFERPA